MNGIIHVCSRAIASSGAPYTEAEMFLSIFAYVQALVEKVRPKKVLFLAVDGTEFMQRMSTHLRYLIAQRVSEDVTWRNLQVIFSGPEVPGEGEHKVMEYIRLNKAKADYDPNVRHCLYGLDADLILLGLLSHDPHFALLREEVTFGRGNQVKKSAADTKFFLLHLCLMREYMDLEFAMITGHTHSLERLIDDFILMMCLVGNDFLPNLPGFHLGEGVLETIFNSYKKVLPLFNGGHLNNNGQISFRNLAFLMHELVDHEKSQLILSEPSLVREAVQEKIDNKAELLRSLIEHFCKKPHVSEWAPARPITGGERKLLTDVAQKLELFFKITDSNIVMSRSRDISPVELRELEEELSVLEEPSENRFDRARHSWKRSYYLQKLHFDMDEDKESLQELLRNYAEGLQWNMLYYYEGVASWSWFYPYHYAPHISDLADFMTGFTCGPFDLGTPLLPLEQLMAVLPPASRALVPSTLATLMTDPNSPLIDFYPSEFTTDANGKKASWEAIVMIPFIDETLLLPALQSRYAKLSAEETARNKFGNTIGFEYRRPGRFVASPSTEFSPILDCSAHEVIYELPILQPNERFIAALCSGARIGLHAMPGFPTLATLPAKGVLDSGIGLDVFGQISKGLSMVLTVAEGGVFGSEQVANISERILGRRVYMNWPHLREGRVAYVSDGCRRYAHDSKGELQISTLESGELDNFSKMCTALEKEYRKRCAILVGPVEILVWVCPFVGMKMSPDGSTRKQYDEVPLPCALQTIVEKRVDSEGMEVEDERFEESSAADTDISALFPLDSTVIYLGQEAYGTAAVVLGNEESPRQDRAIEIRFAVKNGLESSFTVRLANNLLAQSEASFVSSAEICRSVGISSYLLSKITSTLTLFLDGNLVRAANLGLDLKSQSKGICAVGLARKRQDWKFARTVMDLLKDLKRTFPDVFARLEVEKNSANVDAQKIFPSVSSREELLAEVDRFRELIKQKLGKPIHVPINGQYLDARDIAEIQSAVQQDISETRNPSVKTAKVSIETILSPATVARLRTHRQNFNIGERVVCVSSAYFGQKGTIVGYDVDQMNVLMDNAVLGGADLDGLVENGRGLVLPPSECLNTSRPQPPPGVTFKKAEASPIQSQRPIINLPKVAARPGPLATRPDVPRLQSRPIKLEELFSAATISEKSNQQFGAGPSNGPSALPQANPQKISNRLSAPAQSNSHKTGNRPTAPTQINPHKAGDRPNAPIQINLHKASNGRTQPIVYSSTTRSAPSVASDAPRPQRPPRAFLDPNMNWKRAE
ncbi:5'-3' exoribonuclease 1 [Paramicrosporidium saccamoebae]|uniref:5'-3' exoribonuclease 1 n=1 Tax=Paramicrosporidium saccamoebae TaxID=1246581 RepID=A0A2H9TJJ2_9FUNG|nr:5'-3' exoribonuclease 1 [Paramicrosporidium saccamoebae]